MVTITVYRDKIINSIARWRGEDATRASDVGEQREEIASLIETTGVHKKALSWIRSLDKLEADKRDDILRSFDALRTDIMEPHWGGQKTPDMFADSDAVEPDDGAMPRQSYEPDPDFEGDPDIQDDADDFKAALADAAE